MVWLVAHLQLVSKTLLSSSSSDCCICLYLGGYGAVYKETPHAKQGDVGSKLPGEEANVEWTAGQEVTVAWTIQVILLLPNMGLSSADGFYLGFRGM